MTAIAAKTHSSRMTLAPIHFTGIILGLLLLGAYLYLPFVNQPELGSSTINLLTETRSNNELDLPINGLALIPLAGLGAVLLGVWNVIQPQASRVIRLILAVCGLLSLTYFIIYALAYFQAGADYLGVMGVAFWAMLAITLLLIAQAAIPRGELHRDFTVAKILGNQESVLVFGMLALIMLVGLANPRFLSGRNVTGLVGENAYIAVAAIGMSMVIITGNIDISVGSLVGLMAAISGRMVVDIPELPVWVSWLAPIAIGALTGALLGFLVAYLRIPSIVVSLGFLSIFKGILIIWTAGERVVDMPESYYLSQMDLQINLFGFPIAIPMPIIFMVVLTIAGMLFMRYTPFGRSLYAVGGNKEATRLSGIDDRRVVLLAFVINHMFVGVAALLYATQFQIIQVTPPPGLELTIITASVVGGVSILGGVGTVIGSTIAAILLNVIRAALLFIDISPFWLRAVSGLLILITVLADLYRRWRQRI